MITLINGLPQSPAGLIVPNGSIGFQLNADATVVAAPFGFVAAAIEVVFQFNAAGILVQPAKIWSNAELNPQNSVGLGTYYLVTFYDQNGARLNTVPMWWQFPEAANSTVDIGEMVPFATIGGNVIFYPTAFVVPVPGPLTLGGVFSNAGTSGFFITAINTDGSVSLAQPTLASLVGTLPLAQGGTGTSLAATGGAGFVLQQSTVGGLITAGLISASSLSSVTGTGAVVLAGGTPTITGVLSTKAITPITVLAIAAQPVFRLVDSELSLTFAGSTTIGSGSGSIAGVRGNITQAAGNTVAGGYEYGVQGKLAPGRHLGEWLGLQRRNFRSDRYLGGGICPHVGIPRTHYG